MLTTNKLYCVRPSQSGLTYPNVFANMFFWFATRQLLQKLKNMVTILLLLWVIQSDAKIPEYICLQKYIGEGNNLLEHINPVWSSNILTIRLTFIDFPSFVLFYFDNNLKYKIDGCYHILYFWQMNLNITSNFTHHIYIFPYRMWLCSHFNRKYFLEKCRLLL